VLAAHPPDPPLAPRECGPSVSEVPLARLHEVQARSNPAPFAAFVLRYLRADRNRRRMYQNISATEANSSRAAAT